MKNYFNDFAHMFPSAYPIACILESQKAVVGFQKKILVLGNPWIIKEDLEPESEITSVLAISFLKNEVSNSSFIFRSTMKAFIYFSRRSQQDRAARRCAAPGVAHHRRRAAVLAVAAATLCKRQKTSPLLFKSSTKSVFHCCYRWAASYLPLPAAGDRHNAATAVGSQSQMSAAAQLWRWWRRQQNFYTIY
jgi:hypothetical protein